MAITLGFGKTYTSTTDEHGVGSTLDQDGVTYRWVQFVDVAAEEGGVCKFADATATDFEVTMDTTGGTNVGDKVAGIAMTTVAIDSYGWAAIRGKVPVRTDGTVTAGDFVVPHATNNGEADVFTDPGNEELIFGMALEADNTTTLDSGEDGAMCYVNC